jgi:hypothetical protein
MRSKKGERASCKKSQSQHHYPASFEALERTAGKKIPAADYAKHDKPMVSG